MIVGEILNFAAYAFAPAILVTPLGALSIIVRYITIWHISHLGEAFLQSFCWKFLSCSAVLAHFCLDEKLHTFGVLGCVLCVVGSISIVMHAPKEMDIESVKQVWHLALQPGNLTYKRYDVSTWLILPHCLPNFMIILMMVLYLKLVVMI